MSFLDVIQSIRTAPHRYLGELCPWQFDIFLSGYRLVDSGKTAATAAVARAIAGDRSPGEATGRLGPGELARLAEPDPRRALEWVLGLYEQTLLEHGEDVVAMPYATVPVVEMLREHVAKGLTPVVMQDLTLTALFSFVSGYLAGLEATNPALAASERAALAAFEQWLRTTPRDDCRNASWHVILRAYRAVRERGASDFLTRWDRHVAQSTPAPPAPAP